ncbi:RBBP9/YdeN family alpha/beta hydrolase [Sphingomonas quercus]|uniref:Alpha/beta hydrolase n=1 Tax=Sphingomonas quercus TaxID=2842451 RepID=A0ABS6BLL1_9SPHN|nr:alpha/beta hydrolase [Sphingomonas quercus]MBU3079199.1 alpha/beta hydrolase [Sphingomonas quercus]
MFEDELRRAPLCLTIPGLGNSGPNHWQSIWERTRHDCRRVQLGCWNEPDRNIWVSAIEQAVAGARGPVILAAHSLGCLAVAWWTKFLGAEVLGRVRGALLVAPPDLSARGLDPRIARFAPMPGAALPFPAIVVASEDDPYARLERSREMAGAWLADFVNVGPAGHINAASELGEWRAGQQLLELLIDESNELSHYSRPASRLAHHLHAS